VTALSLKMVRKDSAMKTIRATVVLHTVIVKNTESLESIRHSNTNLPKLPDIRYYDAVLKLRRYGGDDMSDRQTDLIVCRCFIL
jgi:hypothetical protein